MRLPNFGAEYDESHSNWRAGRHTNLGVKPFGLETRLATSPKARAQRIPR